MSGSRKRKEELALEAKWLASLANVTDFSSQNVSLIVDRLIRRTEALQNYPESSASSVFRFIHRVAESRKGIFSGTSLEQMLSLCVSYVKEPSGARKSTVSGLTALLSLIQNADIREFLNQLIGSETSVLVSLLASCPDDEICYLVFRCMEAACASLVSQSSSNRELIHSTLPFVCHFLHNFNKSANVLIAALKTLENLIATSSKLFIESSIGTLMTVLKRFALYADTEIAVTSPGSFPPSYERPSSSESEQSDSETGQSMTSHTYIRGMAARIRIPALNCLQKISELVDKKVVFGYWGSFISDSPSCRSSLLTLLLSDPSQKVRECLAGVLMSFLDASKPLLMAADDSDHVATSFIPFSISLGSMLQQLHGTLYRVIWRGLLNKKSLLKSLKCLSVLISNSPYYRLRTGYLSTAAHILIPLVRDKVDIPLDSAFLTWLFGGSDQIIKTSAKVDSTSSTPWILDACFGCFRLKGSWTDIPSLPPVRIVALRIFALLFKNYSEILVSFWSKVIDVAILHLSDDDSGCRFHSTQVLYEWSARINEILRNDASKDDDLIAQVLVYWNQILSGSFSELLSVESSGNDKTLCASAIECLGNIGAEVFSKLSKEKEAFVLSICLSLVQNETSTIAAAAIRVIGIFVSYESLLSDIPFMLDASQAVASAMRSAALAVRIKAAWSLANLADSLAGFSLDCEDFCPPEMYQLLLEVAVKGCKDNDKVRSNALRAVGNLFRLASARFVSEYKSLIIPRLIDAVGVISKGVKTGNVKVRWNACHAAGHLLRNVFLLDSREIVIDPLLCVLCDAICKCKNFKVRITAASALGSLSSRDHLHEEQTLRILVDSLFTALEKSDELTDFSEVKYRKNLKLQLMECICHVETLAGEADRVMIADVLRQKLPGIEHHLEATDEEEEYTKLATKIMQMTTSKGHTD
ncbi:HEAT repeat-containing protein 6-like isoform X2 [Oscarella lobularis]|uniref:HEAT repeat-containing protein 6-like isoform X2 n=1 Tax=Oscarella lobularis TaxID=121494 RepID=UPI003313EE55